MHQSVVEADVYMAAGGTRTVLVHEFYVQQTGMRAYFHKCSMKLILAVNQVHAIRRLRGAWTAFEAFEAVVNEVLQPESKLVSFVRAQYKFSIA